MLPPSPGCVEEQLADVQPLINAARAAVGGIMSEHLTEIRSLRMAPDAIRWVGRGRGDAGGSHVASLVPK